MHLLKHLIRCFKDSKKIKKLQGKGSKRKKRRSSLPRPFQLPKHYPKFVKQELSTGILSGKARTRLIFTVANAMFEYTHYPTREEYDHVARQIVRKYEFMSDDRGSHVSLTWMLYYVHAHACICLCLMYLLIMYVCVCMYVLIMCV